jgi:hypothetical protein
VKNEFPEMSRKDICKELKKRVRFRVLNVLIVVVRGRR